MMMDAKISPQSDGLAIGNNRGYKPLFIVSQTIVFILFLLLLTLIFKYLGGFGFEVASVFNFHPMFMMLGFIILYSNSILIYRTFRYELKQKLKLAHTILNGAAIVVSMFGSLSVFYYHQKANIPHFYSLHSWLGISTWLLFVSQFTSGFVTFLYPGASYTMRSLLMPLHRYSGIATFVLAAAACLTGLNEKAIFALKDPKYSDLPASGVLFNLIGIILCAYASLIVYLVTKYDYQRKPLAEEQVINLNFNLSSPHSE